MAVFNTTYNYNQERMGFGQAIAMGALGSIGGYYGGGYGMGMNNSLFTMMNMGIGGCGCGFGYSNDIIGMQIGNMISNVFTGCLSMAFSGRADNDDEPKVKSDSELKSDAQKYVDEKNPELKSDIEAAKANLETAKTQADIIKGAQSNIDLLNNDIKTLEGKKQSDAGITDPAKKNEIKEANDKIDEQIKAKKELIKEANTKIDKARLELSNLALGVDIPMSNIDTESIVNAAKAKVEAAEKAREDKIEDKFNELKNEQNTSVKSKSSKQLSKAQRQAEKAEAKKAKAEAKAQQKAEKEEAERIENDRKEIRKDFNDALDVYKKSGKIEDFNNAKKIVDKTDDVELQTALRRTLSSTLPKKQNHGV